MCAPPHSLHHLYLPLLLLPANFYVCEITHMHTRTNTRLGDNPRSPNTHKGCVCYVFEQTQRQYKIQITEQKRKKQRESGGEGGVSLRNRPSCMERATFACGRGDKGGSGRRSKGVDCMCVAHMSKNQRGKRERTTA